MVAHRQPAIAVARHAHGADFLAAAAPLLAHQPAVRAFYTVFALAAPERIDGVAAPRYMATAAGDAAGVAMQGAPDRQLIIDGSDVAAAAALARDFAATGRALCGLLGGQAACEAFLAAWQALRGGSYVRDVNLRHHQLTALNELPGCAGGMRQATTADADWLVAQQHAFVKELRLPDPPERIEAYVLSRLAQQRFWLWVVDGPAGHAGYSDAGEAGARIGPVWTMPAARGRGYATALVGALSRTLLRAGKDRLFLVTDADNPTSNKVYARVGFVPQADFCEYRKTDSA